MKITLHSKDGCPYCSMARAWLADRNLAVEEVKWNDDAERRSLYADLSREFGQKVSTVPQIVLEEKGRKTLINGFTALKTSELAQRLSTSLDDVDF